MSKFCLYCGVSLLENARFCHSCGESVSPQLVKCGFCAADNPAHARFCSSCGEKMQARRVENKLHNRYHLDLDDLHTLPQQFKAAFLNFFKISLAQDGFDAFADQAPLLFEQSGFRQQYFEEQSITWAAEAEQSLAQLGKNALYKIEAGLSLHFSAAYLYFCSHFAQPHLPIYLPPQVVGYEYQLVENISLSNLISDYVRDLNEHYYLHLVNIPLQKLRAAQEAFFKPQLPSEMAIFYLEQSANAGIILTEYGIYWKMSFHRPAAIAYRDISSLRNHGSYLHVNNIYLAATERFNYRLFKLLQKLQQIFQS